MLKRAKLTRFDGPLPEWMNTSPERKAKQLASAHALAARIHKGAATPQTEREAGRRFPVDYLKTLSKLA